MTNSRQAIEHAMDVENCAALRQMFKWTDDIFREGCWISCRQWTRWDRDKWRKRIVVFKWDAQTTYLSWSMVIVIAFPDENTNIGRQVHTFLPDWVERTKNYFHLCRGSIVSDATWSNCSENVEGENFIIYSHNASHNIDFYGWSFVSPRTLFSSV